MTGLAEETGDHLLRSASSTNNFRWIWLVFEDSYIRDLKHRNRIFPTFFTQIDMSLFLSDSGIRLFTAVEAMPKDASISPYVT